MATATENKSDVGQTAVTPAPTTSKTRKLLLALALLLLLAATILAAIPPLVIGGMVNQRVAFSQTWTGAEHDLTPDRLELIIHSTDDSQVPFANYERIMAHAPDHVETWVRHGDLHFIVQDGHFLNPQEDAPYAARIIHFLDRHFGGQAIWPHPEGE
jgi:hypothetical protein